MSDLIDYIKWRGDLTFEQSSFNEVDNLIFSFVSYVDYSGIVPEDREVCSGKITVREASEKFWKEYTDQEILDKPTLTKMSAFVLREMASSRRFGNLCLSHYVNEVDEESQKQFAALRIQLGEHLYYVAFRGTDETIVGWQEDFNMVYLPEVPSERRAVEYLREIMDDSDAQEKYYIGGHSKGGHLAIYAAVRCFKKFGDHILLVYNNDGPGVSASMASSEEYQQMLSKIVSYVPEQSFFGLMLCHEENVYTVKSNGSGLLQHDSLSWEVLGSEFVKVEGVSPQSRETNTGLKNWLALLSLEERGEMIRLIFHSLSLAEIKTIGDFARLTPKRIYDLIRNLKDLEAGQKALVTRSFRLLVHELKGKERGKKGKKILENKIKQE